MLSFAAKVARTTSEGTHVSPAYRRNHNDNLGYAASLAPPGVFFEWDSPTRQGYYHRPSPHWNITVPKACDVVVSACVTRG